MNDYTYEDDYTSYGLNDSALPDFYNDTVRQEEEGIPTDINDMKDEASVVKSMPGWMKRIIFYPIACFLSIFIGKVVGVLAFLIQFKDSPGSLYVDKMDVVVFVIKAFLGLE